MRRLPPVEQRGCLGFRAWTGQPVGMTQAHLHHDLEANWVEQGSLTYLLGGRIETIPAQRLGLFWGAVPHRLLDVAPETRCGWLTLPLRLALAWRLDLNLLLAGRLLVDALGRDDRLSRFEAWGRELTGGDPWATIAALEIEARLKRLLLSRQDAASGDSAPGPSDKVAIMVDWLDRHQAGPVRVAEVAQAAGLHSGHAQELFRRRCGLSIRRYLTRLRVANAQRLLATTDLDLLQVGLHCGFASASRFFAAFQAVAGTSPGRWRRDMALACPTP